MSEDLLEAYAKLPTPAVCDALDGLGLAEGWLSHDIRPAWQGARLAGRALTARLAPLAPDEGFDESLAMSEYAEVFRDVPVGSVVVLDMSDEMIAAGWGQVTSQIARAAGCSGALIGGPVRDITSVAAQRFPVFSHGYLPSSIRGRFRVEGVQVPVTVGGRRVEPGDLVLGDANGAVVVRAADAATVLEAAGNLAHLDSWWMEQLDAGRDPIELEKEHPLP
ncbi:MAG: 4-hydroxy-4-methyl-2-oxoglutarate aldolase/4-carboxy-4-hydroxy-2-oxoadipate aldolase [Acidimicrobiales bacterium]|nr:4-hydroxy-4-methyl-2-oxoglutarate aldolase/4-carboxy-4-hydroxy-2-oxoadipate aldolase [Acidimicrobiales bacterium]